MTLSDSQLSEYLSHADALERQGKYTEAEATLLKALHDAAQPPASPASQAFVLNNLGYLYHILRRWDDARNALLRSVHFWKETGDTLRLIRTSDNLISVYVECGEIPVAARFWRATLEPLLKTLEPDSTERATLLAEGAAVDLASKEYRKAEPLVTEAIAIWERRHEATVTDLALALSNRATIRVYTGRAGEAKQDADRALDILRANHNVAPPLVATVVNNVGVVWYVKGWPAEAEEFFKNALDALAEQPDSPSAIPILNNYSLLLHKSGRAKEAKVLAERSKAISQGVAGGAHRNTVDASELSLLQRK